MKRGSSGRGGIMVRNKGGVLRGGSGGGGC